MKLKRIGPLAIATAVLMSVGFLDVERGYAAERKCTLDSRNRNAVPSSIWGKEAVRIRCCWLFHLQW